MLHLHVKTNQAFLTTAGFLHKHSYVRKNFAVVSVNRHQFQGDFVPLTPNQGLCPWTLLRHSPQTRIAAPHFSSRNISGTICEISCAPLRDRLQIDVTLLYFRYVG